MAPPVARLLQQAVQLHRQGRLAEAERLYADALAQDLKNFDALHLFGMLRLQQGRTQDAAELVSAALKRRPGAPEALTLMGSIMLALQRAADAVGYFDRAVVAQPDNPDARFNRAVALGHAGRLPQALADYDHIVTVRPGYAEAWLNRGNVLAQLGRYEEATDSYDRALAIAPHSPDTLNNRGNALAALGRHTEAVAAFDQALALAPGHADAGINRATALKELGRLDEALAACDRALTLRPAHAGAHMTRGNVLHAMKQYEEAIKSYDRALALAPNDIEILNNRTVSLLEAQRPDEALANAERAVALDPRAAIARLRRGSALQALGRDAAAIEDFRQAIALDPGLVEAHHNLGSALQALERHADALPHFHKAMELRPGFHDARTSAAISHLTLGQFAAGWDMYEHRFANQGEGTPPRDYPQPRWDGRPVEGALLVWCEQGIGDQILYAGLLPELVPLAGTVTVEVDGRLVDLFRRSFPEIVAISYRPEPYDGRIDAQVPIASLPKQFRRSWEDFPRRERGYLLPDPGRVQALRARLASGGTPVVGLSWISRNARYGQYKSAQIKDFAPLLTLPGYRFIDLQYGDTAAEREAIERELGVRVERLDDIDNMNDIDGLAALICACDAVLTVSSTTAHLAGAAGAPTWVMVPFGRGRFWYWFADRPASPWYPHTQVRRQGQGESWADLIAALAPEVAQAAAVELSARRVRG